MRKIQKLMLIAFLSILSVFTFANSNIDAIISSIQEAVPNCDFGVHLDKDNRIIIFENENFDTYKYAYNESNLLESETNFLGNKKSYTYTPEGKINCITDFNGQSIDYIYENDILDKILYQNGEFKDFDFDSQNRLKKIVNQDSELVFEYNDLNELVQIQDLYKNQSVNCEYDEEGNRKKILWGNDNKSLEYFYNDLGQLSELISPEGKSCFSYDFEGREKTKTLPNGNIIETDYYADDQIKSIITKDSNNNIIDSIGYIYNPEGNLEFKIDHLGQYTQYEYDDKGRVSEILYPFGKGKEIADFKSRLKAGLFPVLINDDSGADIYNETSAIEINIPQLMELDNFDQKNFCGKLQTTLCENKEVFENFTGLNIEKGTWSIIPQIDAHDFVQKAHLNTDSINAMENLLSHISNNSEQLDIEQNMWQECFEYDNSNNIKTISNGWGQINNYYNKTNQLTQTGIREYTYDNNGNLITECLGSVKAEYEYTSDNHLKQSLCTIPGFLELEADLTEYIYDGLGRMIKQIQYETIGETLYQINDYSYNTMDFEVIENKMTELIKNYNTYNNSSIMVTSEAKINKPAKVKKVKKTKVKKAKKVKAKKGTNSCCSSKKGKVKSTKIATSNFNEIINSLGYSVFGQALQTNTELSTNYINETIDSAIENALNNSQINGNSLIAAENTSNDNCLNCYVICTSNPCN